MKTLRQYLKDYSTKALKSAFLRGYEAGIKAKNPYTNRRKYNNSANYGQAFFNAFRRGQCLSVKLKPKQQKLF